VPRGLPYRWWRQQDGHDQRASPGKGRTPWRYNDGWVKTHLAQALAHEACRQGVEVLFVNTHKMLRHLHGGRADGSWDRRLASYVRPQLLVLDDFGLKPLTDQMPADLYDVIHERYEKGSILVTSNRAPAEWPELFGNPLLASAGLDRLAHDAETLVSTGRRYRAVRRNGTTDVG